MTDSPSPDDDDSASPDDGAQTVRAVRERTVRELRELRFIGPATADTLAEGAVTAADIRDQNVSFLRLVQLDVDPGVAARIRREYSLPWSAEPTQGARLRRRAEHIRHLRDDERSWIDESWADRSTEASSTDTAPDGSGSATDAERAWRERGRQTSGGNPDPSDSGPSQAQASGALAGGDPPIDPGEYTVSELEEAVEAIDEPGALALVRQAEWDGKDRTTAVDAIERRLRAVGADPDEVSVPSESGEDAPATEAVAGFRGMVDAVSERSPGSEAIPDLSSVGQAISNSEARARLEERSADLIEDVRRGLARAGDAGRNAGRKYEARFRDFEARERSEKFVEEVRGRLTQVADAGREYEARLRDLEPEEWRWVSMALLVAFVVLSFIGGLLVAIGPATGQWGTALALYVVTLVAGAGSTALHQLDVDGSGSVTLLTGAIGLVAVGLIAALASGTPTPATSSILLGLFGLVAAALLTTTYLSMDEQLP